MDLRVCIVALAAILPVSHAGAQERLVLHGGFLPDPQRVEVMVQGAQSATEWVRGCPGHVTTTPALTVRYLTPGQMLRVVQSGEDLAALVAVGPDGVYRCAPVDAQGLADLVIMPARGGEYALWPAAVVPGVTVAASLLVTERLAAAADLALTPQARLAVDAPPAHGTVRFDRLPATVPLWLEGQVYAAAFGACDGKIEPSRPDVVLDVPPGADMLFFRAEAAFDDTTLLVVDPAGVVHCDDDTEGLDPVVGFPVASPGRYAVWVGYWGEVSGNRVVLRMGQTPAEVGVGEPATSRAGVEGLDTPFLGREIPTALAALDILLEDPAAARALRYGRREALGADGFVLSDVTFVPPDGTQPLSMRELRVTELDRTGLHVAGAPGTFRVQFVGIDYDELADALALVQALTLPELDEPVSLNAEFALLPPPGRADRRHARMALTMDGQVGISLSSRLHWTDAPGLPQDLATVPVERVALEVTNEGYVGALLRSFGAAMGLGPAQAGDMVVSLLSMAMAPVWPGTPQAAMLDALGYLAGDPEGPGVARIVISSAAPVPADALLAALTAANGALSPGLSVDVVYEPMP